MSNNPGQDDELFELLAREHDDVEVEPAPPSVKARLYSALVRQQESSGHLRSLAQTRAAGHGLCVFERFWERVPLGQAAKCFNCCSVCHARVLAEHFERPPIYWGSCPYAAFGKK
jgi:hypothetical protein